MGRPSTWCGSQTWRACCRITSRRGSRPRSTPSGSPPARAPSPRGCWDDAAARGRGARVPPRAPFAPNVTRPLRLTRLFTRALTASRGSVVMINSAVLRHSRLPFGGYKMAKSALLAVAQSLATELGPQGIRVNSVAPGYIWAGSLKWYFGYLAEQRGVDRQQIYHQTPATPDLRQLPEHSAQADAASFLASSLARAITGHCPAVHRG